jgi:hypothetical protein
MGLGEPYVEHGKHRNELQRALSLRYGRLHAAISDLQHHPQFLPMIKLTLIALNEFRDGGV